MLLSADYRYLDVVSISHTERITNETEDRELLCGECS